MPELPDVENYRRYLADHALHQTIQEVVVGSARVVEGVSGRKLAESLKGRSFEEARRHGKHMLVRLDRSGWLALHFGMTGRLAWFSDMGDDPKHDRLRFDFTSGNHLAFVNQRLLGRVGPAESPESFIRRKHLGPDALEIGESEFVARLGHKSGALKSALMDQSLVAGIGNIFSDEILFQTRLHSKVSVGSLDGKALAALYGTMRDVLTTAIAKGAGAEDFKDKAPKSWLLAHRKDGADCPRCDGQVATMKVNSRTAYYCPSCQATG